MLRECNLHTIVRLPNGVFNPYTGIRTNLLFFTKGQPTTEVWYYEHPYPPGAKSYNKGKLNFDLLVRIDPKMVDPGKASICRGDILFNNTNSQELVGKTCLVDSDYCYGFSNHINRIRLKEGIDAAFVVFYLTLLRNSGYFARLCTRWINQAAINTETIKKQAIPLPPLAEQKRIVAKVDELMALCDRLETQQQERGHLSQGSISQMVSIWYRHRNCVVHGGGCFPQDMAFCLRKTKYTNCRMAHEEIIDSRGIRDLFTDGYFQALNRAVVNVISAEIGR